MGKAVKVYNSGVKPIVWNRSHNGSEVIHPGKYDLFSEDKAKEIVKKFEFAVLESDYKKKSEKK